MPAFRVQVPVETGQNKAFGFVQPVGQSAWPFASHQHSRPPVRRRPTADVGANDKISAVPNYKNRRKCRQLIPALNQRVLKRCSRHAATGVSEHSGITVTSAFNESRDSIFWFSAIWQFQVTIRTVCSFYVGNPSMMLAYESLQLLHFLCLQWKSPAKSASIL